jgi:PBSX family phage terminase large subunit
MHQSWVQEPSAMTTVQFEYVPIPVFESFHASTAPDRFLFGGYGSGKSVAGCNEAAAMGLRYPGSEWLVTRKTIPALKDTTEKTFVESLPAAFFEACNVSRAGGHIASIEFPNGSLFHFKGMPDWKRLKSMNLAGIFWDEADEFSPEEFEGMQSRIRQVHALPKAREQGYPKRIPDDARGNILASNPAGKNWLYKEAFESGRRGVESWISTSFDNPYLPAATLNRWLEMPEPWVRRYVLCSFDEFAGSIYPEWGWETHVIDPFQSGGRYTYDSSSWFRMGFDPGTSSGNAGVWVYYDQATHRLIAVAEYLETGLSATVHARAWRRIEAQHGMRVQRRIADPKPISTRDRGTNVTLGEQYARLGFRFALGPSSIADRVTSMGDLIARGRFVVTKDCPRLYEQILGYRWEDLSPDAIAKGRSANPLKKDVDLVDAGQYAVSNYVAPPKVQPVGTPEQEHSREVHTAVRKQIERRRRKPRGMRNDLGMRV